MNLAQRLCCRCGYTYGVPKLTAELPCHAFCYGPAKQHPAALGLVGALPPGRPERVRVLLAQAARLYREAMDERRPLPAFIVTQDELDDIKAEVGHYAAPTDTSPTINGLPLRVLGRVEVWPRVTR